MKNKMFRQLILIIILSMSVIVLPCSASENTVKNTSLPKLSANIPLSSYVYDYIEKLDGLGYLKEMRPGNKPYSRMQVANWIQQIDTEVANQSNVPAYVMEMLSELKNEFHSELSGTSREEGIKLRSLELGAHYYKGEMLEQKGGTKSKYQPLNINNNGEKFSPATNSLLMLRMDGLMGDDLLVSFTPSAHSDNLQENTQLDEAYLKTKINNVEIQLGKESFWWGQGQHGTLLLTNNSSPLNSVVVKNIKPMKKSGKIGFLCPSYATVIYSELEKDRVDVKHPSFLGIRADYTNSQNFSLGLARTNILGGEGHNLSGRDYWDLITGKNADTSNADKWDSIAGVDFRWRLPKLGVNLYGELYGEDQYTIAGFIPAPSENAELLGLYIPRITADGSWDAHIEWARTGKAWYRHSLYTNGYTYKNDIIGDAMGNNAYRYFVKLSNYKVNGVQISLNMEHAVQQFTANTPQIIDSAWLSTRNRIKKDMFLEGSLGMSKIKNFEYTDGKNAKNYLFSLNLTKEY